MFAIVSKSDGFPVSRQVGGGKPDIVGCAADAIAFDAYPEK
jgi:hypothetical protein